MTRYGKLPNPAFAAGGPSRPRIPERASVGAAKKEGLCLYGDKGVARS
jgi:hypothetical protein